MAMLNNQRVFVFFAILIKEEHDDTPSNMRVPGYPIFKQTHLVESDMIWNLQIVYVDLKVQVLAIVDGLN